MSTGSTSATSAASAASATSTAPAASPNTPSTDPTAVNQNLPKFDTDEVLWYNNGIWGQAGYAVCNPMGKTLTSNGDIYDLHSTVGMVMFDLLHRRDAVCFVRPPHKQWLYDLHQMIVVARKRLNDLTRAPNDSNGLVVTHAQPAPRMFVVFPTPFFGDRIRNPDIRKYATIAQLMLSEIMQHSDNDIVGYVTPSFTATVGVYLQEILAQMAMKFFGYTRAQAYDATFTLQAADFTNYDPTKVMINVEMSMERPPEQWWPTTNDLSKIRALPIADALQLATKWPSGPDLYSGDASAFPGEGLSASDASTGATATSANASTAPGTSSGSFVATPGQAP